MKLSLQITGLDQIKKQLSSLSGAQLNSALSMAINKTAAKGKTEIDRAVRERYDLRRDEVSNSVTLSGASSAKLEATISIFGSAKKRGRSLNVIHFAEKKVTIAEHRRRNKAGTANQLRFKFLKQGGLKTIAADPTLKNGPFIGNKGRTVFRRTGKDRLSIEPVQVIGVSGMFSYDPIKKRVLRKMQEEFNTEFNRAVRTKLRAAK